MKRKERKEGGKEGRKEGRRDGKAERDRWEGKKKG